MTQEDKDKMVEIAVFAGSPLIGAINSVRNILGGDPEYVKIVS